jgi:uncharacterized protein YceH (UPF0502 family)
MSLQLSAIEARVIGCLLEKEVTTPDYYPLTLNSLTAACNQKSNRDPVMDLSDSQVVDAIDGLIARRLASDESGFNSRTSKYQHRFCNTEFGDLQFNEQELAIICCLLLRGPQTPGELRTRTNRLCHFNDVKETEAVLDQLQALEFVEKLEREPGKREARYRQCFTEYDSSQNPTATMPMNANSSDNDDRIAMLELEIVELKQQVLALTEKFAQHFEQE